MCLGTVNISLIVGLEFKYLLFQLYVQFVHMVQLSVLLVKSFAVLVN
jgi:hypothetical protein